LRIDLHRSRDTEVEPPGALSPLIALLSEPGPVRARESPLYRLAEMHHETFKQVYDERFVSRYGAC
jgi:hypothetical protein